MRCTLTHGGGLSPTSQAGLRRGVGRGVQAAADQNQKWPFSAPRKGRRNPDVCVPDGLFPMVILRNSSDSSPHVVVMGKLYL